MYPIRKPFSTEIFVFGQLFVTSSGCHFNLVYFNVVSRDGAMANV